MKSQAILFFQKKLNPSQGGVQRVSYAVGEGLRSRGHKVFYAFETQDSDLIPAEHKFCCDGLSEEELTLKLKDFVSSKGIEVIISQNQRSKLYRNIFLSLKTSCNISLISCLHATPDYLIKKSPLNSSFFKTFLKSQIRKVLNLFHSPITDIAELYKISNFFLVPAISCIDDFKDIYSVPAKATNVRCIYNPHTIAKGPNLDKNTKKNQLLVVARMEESQKRISHVLRMWKNLYPKHKDWILIIVGDGPDLDKYKQYARKLRLERIYFEGYQPNPYKYYMESKIFLMTSFWEGLTTTNIEALNYDCVPVVYDCGSAIKDVVIDECNGRVIPFNDLLNYTKAVDRLMADSAFLEKLRKADSSFLFSRINLENIIDQWEDLLIMECKN